MRILFVIYVSYLSVILYSLLIAPLWSLADGSLVYDVFLWFVTFPYCCCVLVFNDPPTAKAKWRRATA